MEDTSYISPKNLGSLHEMRAQITIQRELLLRSSACFIFLKLGFHATMNQKQKWEQQQSGTQGTSQVKMNQSCNNLMVIERTRSESRLKQTSVAAHKISLVVRR